MPPPARGVRAPGVATRTSSRPQLQSEALPWPRSPSSPAASLAALWAGTYPTCGAPSRQAPRSLWVTGSPSQPREAS